VFSLHLARRLPHFNFHNKFFAGVTENVAVPQAYLDKNIPLARERLNIGGYRLYYILNFIFGSSNDVTEEELGEFTTFIKSIFGIDESQA
jgi:hypothetical protein